jgi:hypothetical protein
MTVTSLIDAELAWVPRARRPCLRLACGNLRVLGKRELDREERAPRGMSVPSTWAGAGVEVWRRCALVGLLLALPLAG